MEAKTLTPGAPETLAAGELVWAKPRGRSRTWWPARLLSACPAAVSYFGKPGAPPGSGPTQVWRFAVPDADNLARGSTSHAFLAAVEEAQAHAVAALRAALACGCVPPPPPEAAAAVIVAGVPNLATAEFVAMLREAALDPRAGLVDLARLRSWVRAFGEGWGPGGAGHYPRRSLEDLVDKIDLDVPAAGPDKDDDDWLAEDEQPHNNALEGRPQETPMQKKRSVAALVDELDAEEDKDDSATGPGTSGKRQRKRSKYLSPPYTNVGVVVLPRKAVDLPKAPVSPDSIVVEEVLLLVWGLGNDVCRGSQFPKAAEEFLGLFRRSVFKEVTVYESLLPVPVLKIDLDAALKSGKSVSKRSRKKEEDGSVSSTIKRKKREETSPPAAIDCGLPITPAVPMRQVKAQDTRGQMQGVVVARGMGVGVHDEKGKPSVIRCPTSAAIPGTTKPEQEQVQPNDGSVLKTLLAAGNSYQSARENDDAKLGDSVLECPISAAVPETTQPGQEPLQANDGSAAVPETTQPGQEPQEAVQANDGSVANVSYPDPTNSTHKKKKKDTQYFENPAAIVVEFTPGAVVPSREELLSAFGKFGFLIESQTDIAKATCSARIVFGKSTEADRAYNCAAVLGEFGPPFATLRLDYLPPIKLSVPSPSSSLASKPPLSDIRKNLEKMILARHSSLKQAASSDRLKPVSDKLLGEMQGLLSQVDKVLSGPSTCTPP